MTQLCCYRVWDGTLERFRKGALILAVIELFVISAVITFVGISLYHVSFEDPPSLDPADSNNELQSQYENETGSAENETVKALGILCESGEISEDGDCFRSDMSTHANQTARFFPSTPYFQVVGYRIAKSIQLIIYTVQLFITVILIRGVMWTDTQSMRTWLIVTEVITTMIFLILLLYLFGDFKLDTTLVLGAYLVYQVIMIRTVARLIRRTEIELTQFGSVIEF